jgi:hypothetical protein
MRSDTFTPHALDPFIRKQRAVLRRPRSRSSVRRRISASQPVRLLPCRTILAMAYDEELAARIRDLVAGESNLTSRHRRATKLAQNSGLIPQRLEVVALDHDPVRRLLPLDSLEV